ncbi:MAG: serine/threonine protein kinase [Myxococcales bacterium]|nr:serine/threonine protein kinase [Myxococcales bacterium]
MIGDDTLPEGTRLGGGRYEIIHRLGRGGVATVYLARHTELSTRVALKILSEQRAQNLDAVMRFRNEVELAAGLPPHPCIVRPFEMGTFDELGGRPYMSMEYAPGPTLGDLVMAKPLDAAKACRLVMDVAEALSFLHSRGIIHRDVKPSNVIVTRDAGLQRAKLLDFGYAFDLARHATGPEDRLTQIDERPGTKHYMAPEQARGELPAPSFDVYALAISLYEVLVGNPPYHTHSPRDVVLRKVDPAKPSFSIRGKREDLPESLCALVDRGLEREPERRIASAAEFRDELRRVLAELDEGHVSVPSSAAAIGVEPGDSIHLATVPRPRSARRRASTLQWVGFGSAILMVVAIFVMLAARFVLRDSPPGATEESPSRQDAVMSEHSRGQPRKAEVAESADPAQAKDEPEPSEPAELEPIKVAEPAPSPIGPKAPRKKANPRPEPEPEPAPEPAETPQPLPCTEVRAQADDASRDRKWAEVVRLTKRRECWANDKQREALRVQALFRLERYGQCAAMKTSTDPGVQRTAKMCETRLAKEQDP